MQSSLLKLIVAYCCFVIVFPQITQYQQNDYQVISERFEIVSNPKLIHDLKYTNFKFNRTFHCVNISFTTAVAFGMDVKIIFSSFKFASNEYRPFPMQFNLKACDILQKNTFGLQNLYACGTAPECPIPKGSYQVCNFQPDYTKFPPYIPSGKYRIDLNFTYLSEYVGTAQWYMTIKRELKFH